MHYCVNVDDFFCLAVRHLLNQGVRKIDRTGTGTISDFGGSVRFDLRIGFPLLSLKAVPYKMAIKEMLWFLSGNCNNVNELKKVGVPFWNDWAGPKGELGPIYGSQWRHWGAEKVTKLVSVMSEKELAISYKSGVCERGPTRTFVSEVDQIKVLIDGLIKKPYSRRHIVESWNVSCLPDENLSPQANAVAGLMALPPCHKSFQCVVTPPKREGDLPVLNLSLQQRSSDVMIGLPVNIAQYAFLLSALARTVNMTAGILQVNFGDIHIYTNHVESLTPGLVGAETLVKNGELARNKTNPSLFWVGDSKHLLDVTSEDYGILDYNPICRMDLKVSV